MIYHLSNARKYCQIRLILPDYAILKPSIGRIRENFIPKPNINDIRVTINQFFI